MKTSPILPVLLVTCGMLIAGATRADTRVPGKGEIIIPSVEFAETPLRDALDFLVQRSVELDEEEAEAIRRGINVVLVGENLRDEPVTVSLRNVPVGEILRVVAELVDAELAVGPEVIVMSEANLPSPVRRSDGSESLEEKMKSIVVPSVEFAETPLGDCLEFLATRSRELMPGGESGLNLVLKGDRDLPVTFRVQNVSLFRTLELVALMAGYEMEIREHLVFFRPLAEDLLPR